MQHDNEQLVLTDLTAGYLRRPVITGLSLPPIEVGQVVSLIGPNAAGKTTLLRAIAGLHPAQGSIHLGARELLGLPLVERAKLVTYMPQSLPQKVALSVLEGVIGALRASPADGGMLSEAELLDRALDVIEQVGISPLAMVGLDHLSGGQRQLASLAQALARTPRVLLLDEPISALDLHYQLRVMQLVQKLSREQGMIVVMVLHDLSIAARWSDRIVVLQNGRVAADGAPQDAITESVLAEVYRVRSRVHSDAAGVRILIDDILP